MSQHEQWYFISFDHGEHGRIPWKRVTEEEFIKVERQAGFYPKGGHGVATGGFGGSSGQQGRVVSPAYVKPDSYEWDTEFNQVLQEEMAKEQS